MGYVLTEASDVVLLEDSGLLLLEDGLDVVVISFVDPDAGTLLTATADTTLDEVDPDLGSVIVL